METYLKQGDVDRNLDQLDFETFIFPDGSLDTDLDIEDAEIKRAKYIDKNKQEYKNRN